MDMPQFPTVVLGLIASRLIAPTSGSSNSLGAIAGYLDLCRISTLLGLPLVAVWLSYLRLGKRFQIFIISWAFLAILSFSIIWVFSPYALVFFAFDGISVIALFVISGIYFVMRCYRLIVPASHHLSSQERKHGMHDPNQIQEKGLYEQITGGEKWSDASMKRKVWLIILVLLTIYMFIISFTAGAPQTNEYGYTTPDNRGSMFLITLVIFVPLLLYAFVGYPRQKRHKMGAYEYRPSGQFSPPQQQTGQLDPAQNLLQQPSQMGTGSLQQSASAPLQNPYAPTADLTLQQQQIVNAGRSEVSQTVPVVQPRKVTIQPLQQESVTSGNVPSEKTIQDVRSGTGQTKKDAPVSPPVPDGNVSILGKDVQNENLVYLSQKARQQGLYIVGVNGTGKSTLIANLILQDIFQGLGVCLLDPHGDLTKAVISRIPDNRLQDVILLTLSDSDYPFGLNLFACPDPESIDEVAITAGFVMHVFGKVWGVGNETPLLSQVLRNVTFTLIQNPGTTIAEIPLLLQDRNTREKLIANIKNTQVKLFWNSYNKLKDREQQEKTSSTLNKVDAFLTQPIIANIVGQSKTSINFREIMDTGKILLVQLSPRLEDLSTLVGSVVIGQLLNAAFSRAGLLEEKRKQFNLYADEYQRYATSDFATLLSEARKYRLATTIGHQTLSQLDEANKGAAANSANMVVFRVTGEDGIDLAKNFDATPPPPEVIGKRPILVPKTDVITHLLNQGHPNQGAMAFLKYLIFFKEMAGDHIDQPHYLRNHGGGIVGGVIIGMKNRSAANKYYDMQKLQQEIKITLHGINKWFYTGQQTRDMMLELPHEILLTFCSAADFDKMLRPFPDHGREISLLCHPDMNKWEEAKQLLMSKPSWRWDEWAEIEKYLRALRTTFVTLCQEPVLVDSGRWEDIYDKPRTYADVQNEIATRLSNQKNYTAKVKTENGEYTMQTIPSKDDSAGSGVSGSSPDGGNDPYSVRLELVREQTRKLYCRPRLEVEEEIVKRHEELMRDDGGDNPKITRFG